ARSVLTLDYGVDLSKIHWVCTDDEHVAEFKLPAFADYNFKGREIGELFAEGEIVAAVGTLPKPVPNVQPLIPNADEAGFESYSKTGVYPGNHSIVVRDELLAENPTLAVDLCNALKTSKDAYFANLGRSGDLPEEDALTVKLENGLDGDPFPYGLEPNRKGLEALTQTAFDQLITTRKYSVEELFPESTLDLVG
ncbi:ABC transporter substrate-binding protein, partial [Alphaproteobacteria bacterium]|nr:ABC transporter substrate-binding protein [Alphaproteobacteria bacterium]